MLFQPSKSHRSSAERNAIYIFHYLPSPSHLSPSFLLSLSDLISRLLSSLTPPALALLVLSISPFFSPPLLSLSFFLLIHFFLILPHVLNITSFLDTVYTPPSLQSLYFSQFPEREPSNLEAAHLSADNCHNYIAAHQPNSICICKHLLLTQ